MRIKIVGFKVGESRPTANRTIKGWPKEVEALLHGGFLTAAFENFDVAKFDDRLGETVREVLEKSDFISIRRVNE